MVATAFDALHVARQLKAAGVESAQAEAIAEGIRQAATADRAELATKTDIASVRAEVANLRSEMRWMFGFMAALIFAMAGKLFGVF